MRQFIPKAVFNVGLGTAVTHVGFGGLGNTALATTFGADYAKVVIPVDGTFSHLNAFSPAGTHPKYIITLYVNGVATLSTCTLLANESYAMDAVHIISVVAGDDVYFSVNVDPPGSGVGYHLGFSMIFEGNEQFYGITPEAGAHNVDTFGVGGALGNGILEIPSATNQYSNTRSLVTAPGVLTGMRMKRYSSPTGGGWTAYIIKNKVLQDGTAGTVNTACVLTDSGAAQSTNSFTLPVDFEDRIDFALLRTGTTSPSGTVNVAISVTFNPFDGKSIMLCGGSNNANDPVNTEYRWMNSKQLTLDEGQVQCPATETGFLATGLLAECNAPGTGKSVTYTIRKNGVDTPATVVISDLNTIASISGFNIDYTRDDLISLKAVPSNNPSLGNGMWWGLRMEWYTDRSGLYYIGQGTHDRYYGQANMKIPDPTIKTAIVGE